MNEQFSSITGSFLLQSQEAIRNLGKCLETLQKECLENNQALQLDQIQLFDKYERFLSNLSSLQLRSEHIKQKLTSTCDDKNNLENSKQERISFLKTNFSSLMSDFAEINTQLQELSTDINNASAKEDIDPAQDLPLEQQHQLSEEAGSPWKEQCWDKEGSPLRQESPSQHETPGSTFSFQPKPLKLLEKTVSEMNNYPQNGAEGHGPYEHKKSPIKKRHSRRRNSNDELRLPSIFNGRNRISIALFQEDDIYSPNNNNNNNTNDDETVIYPMLDPADEVLEETISEGNQSPEKLLDHQSISEDTPGTQLDDFLNNEDLYNTRPALRRYNSHESILSVQKTPLLFHTTGAAASLSIDNQTTSIQFNPGNERKPAFAGGSMLWNACSSTATTAAIASSTIVNSSKELSHSSSRLLLSQISSTSTGPPFNNTKIHHPITRKPAGSGQSFWNQLKQYTAPSAPSPPLSEIGHRQNTNTSPNRSYKLPQHNRKYTNRGQSLTMTNKGSLIYSGPNTAFTKQSVQTEVQSDLLTDALTSNIEN